MGGFEFGIGLPKAITHTEDDFQCQATFRSILQKKTVKNIPHALLSPKILGQYLSYFMMLSL